MFHHEAKGRYAYAIDLHNLHIRLRTGQDAKGNIKLIAFDPFVWAKDETGEYKISDPVTYEMNIEHSTKDFDWWFAEIKVPTKRAKYAFIVECEDGTYLYGPAGETAISLDDSGEFDISPLHHLGYGYPYILEEDLFHAPSWVTDTVWYQIFPERYAIGGKHLNKGELHPWGSKVEGINQFFGGDILGIASKLTEIRGLGFTGIYLTPIFKSPSTHKYNTEDYYEIDPAFGTKEDFKELVDKAHSLGIKIMIDLVYNHIGSTHPIWQDVVQNGAASKYYNWFCHRDDGSYETFATVKAMPKWNTANPDARAYLMDVTLYWAKTYGIDGFRLDVANEVSHDFWREFRKAVRGVNPEIYILGEVWDDGMPWLMGDQFDGVMNYPLAEAIWSFVSGKTDGAKLRHDISKCLVMYPRDRQKVIFNLLGTHDTSRIMTVCNNKVERVKQAFTLLMTMPGSPMVFYGDEIGLIGDGADEARQCMIWDENKSDLQAFVKDLITLRAEDKDMKSHDIIWHKADNEGVIYQKGSLMVALNPNGAEIWRR